MLLLGILIKLHLYIHLVTQVSSSSTVQDELVFSENYNSVDHESNEIDLAESDTTLHHHLLMSAPYHIPSTSSSLEQYNKPFEGSEIKSAANQRWPTNLNGDGLVVGDTSSNSRYYNSNNRYQQQILGQNTIISNPKSKFVPSSSHTTFANNFNFNYIQSLLTKPSGNGGSISPASVVAHYHAKSPTSSLIVSNLLTNGGQNNLVPPSSSSSPQTALNHSGGSPSINHHYGGALLSSYLSASVNSNNENLLQGTLGIAHQLAQQQQQLPPPTVSLQKPHYVNQHPQQVSGLATAPATSGTLLIDQQDQQGLNSSSSSSSSLINSNQIVASVGDFPGSSSCGRQQVTNAHREPRIVGGNGTYEGEFPWAVSIQRHENHHCGGVIVGRRWILTAAHCVRSQLVGNLLVRTGGSTLARSANSLTSHLERDYSVEQIVMHDDFSRYDNLTASQLKSSANTNNADIALLRLKHDIHLDEFAWPVCFPNKEAGNFSGHEATVIGWGKLNEKSDDFSNSLQKVKLTIIDNRLCQNWFRQAGREMPIDERIICAGFKNGGKDACHGDSGGPLLSRINGQYVVVGVVSTGIGCARPLLPGLYSRVSSYIGWLEKYITN